MAIVPAVGTNAPGLTIGGNDLSDHVQAVEVQQNSADIDVTTMGAETVQHAPGLRDDRIIVTFFQDWAASKVDAVISPLQGSSSGATIVVYSKGTTASGTNPSYTMVGAPYEYSPVNFGAPGAASTTQVTFLPVAGSKITRGTA